MIAYMAPIMPNGRLFVSHETFVNTYPNIHDMPAISVGNDDENKEQFATAQLCKNPMGI
jgi:hypothetical protein